MKGCYKMIKLMPADFNMCSSSPTRGVFVSLEEVNTLIALGVLTLNSAKLIDYHVSTKVIRPDSTATKETKNNFNTCEPQFTDIVKLLSDADLITVLQSDTSKKINKRNTNRVKVKKVIHNI